MKTPDRAYKNWPNYDDDVANKIYVDLKVAEGSSSGDIEELKQQVEQNTSNIANNTRDVINVNTNKLDKDTYNTFKDVILQGVSNAKYNLEKIEEQKKQKNKQEAELKLRDEAIQYLIDNQQKYGVDFTAENALEKANKFAFLKKIADTVKDGELHTFSGDGSCENCEGWDGIDKRCQCGNRRVYWEYSGNFKNMNIYGMAN